MDGGPRRVDGQVRALEQRLEELALAVDGLVQGGVPAAQRVSPAGLAG